MPYIKEEDREEFNELLNKLGELIDNCGEFNYCLTKLMQKYLVNKGLKYQHMNDIIGAVESAKLEIYRRVISNYEDKKIDSNGDVMEYGINDQLKE